MFLEQARFNIACCGRRFGKDIMMITMAANDAAKGRSAALFAPEHKQLTEPFDAIADILRPILVRAPRNEGLITTTTGGVVDFWPVNDNELAGRGREYDAIHINEAAFTKPNMLDIWKKSIRPTLLVRRGSAWVYSTPNGIDPENFFYQGWHDESLGFKKFHAPTSANPLISAEDLEFERKNNDPRVFQQEFLAQFVDWSGEAFFSKDKLLLNGKPVPWPAKCDAVLAIIDSAVKTGKENDGTAVLYCAFSKFGFGPAYKLVMLDWDLVQIEGALLEKWLPSIQANLEMMAAKCGARSGSLGIFIEDAGPSGQVLIQQARNRSILARPIDSKLTSIGKDERAISISGYVYRGEAKFSDVAFDKVIQFKGTSRNHLHTQITGFRVGDKKAASRADDLLDTFVYAVAICCGNAAGF